MNRLNNEVKGAMEKGFLTKLDSRSKLLNIMLQSTMDAFWIMNINGDILESNEASVEILGYSLEELMDIKDVFMAVTEGEAIYHDDGSLIGDGNTIIITEGEKRKDDQRDSGLRSQPRLKAN